LHFEVYRVDDNPDAVEILEKAEINTPAFRGKVAIIASPEIRQGRSPWAFLPR
jgi:hypothetical protein